MSSVSERNIIKFWNKRATKHHPQQFECNSTSCLAIFREPLVAAAADVKLRMARLCYLCKISVRQSVIRLEQGISYKSLTWHLLSSRILIFLSGTAKP